MTIPVFDTHKAVKSLAAAGFNDSQAEAVVETFGNAIGDALVTRADLKAELAGLEHRMTVKLGGLMAAGIGLLALVVGLF